MALRMYSAMMFGMIRLACSCRKKRLGGNGNEDRLSGGLEGCLRIGRQQLGLSRCRHELGRMVCCVLT